MENLKKSKIETEHEEFIHDISFDHFGERIATCSSDFTIKIFYTDSKMRDKYGGYFKVKL